MPPVRPILETFQRTPWIANTPVDDSTVAKLIPQQVHVAFVGDGPASTRRLVPLTPAAHELLHGPSRHGAERVIRGMLATIDGAEGASNLRGMSLANGFAGFATNMMLSNVETGWVPDSVSRGREDTVQFEKDFEQVVAPAVHYAKAQNTGWVDFGPRTSEQIVNLMRHGPAVGVDVAEEVALTAVHELQHSITAPRAPGVGKRLVWLEEGIAETMAWWPGTAGAVMARMGVPPRPGTLGPDVYTVQPGTTASADYRRYHLSVMKLLGMAGITPFDEQGRLDADARNRATQLLQGDPIERVPRNLARAIARERRMDPSDVPALADLITDSAGSLQDLSRLDEIATSARRSSR